MRASVGAALNSAHLEPAEWECAIDRVGALARASKLGRLLYHWQYAGQDRFRGPVLAELTAKAGYRLRISRAHRDRRVLERACKQALVEYHGPNCPTCTGAGEVMSGPLRLSCEDCLGTGRHRYPDEERMRALHVDHEEYRDRWDARINQIIGILRRADGATTRECRRQLERGEFSQT